MAEENEKEAVAMKTGDYMIHVSNFSINLIQCLQVYI
jgi:hypothetical protein